MKLVAALVGVALLGGCTSAAAPSGSGSSAAGLSAAGSSAAGSCLPPAAVPSGPSRSTASGPAAGARVPDLTLDCFPQGGPVRLTALHRPAILNLWASWCAPCRTELPAFQQFADQVGNRVLVLGVDTDDTRDAGSGFLQDAHVTFPNLADRDQRLLKGIGRTALPVTLFVDASGGIRYVYAGGALSESGLADLARTHLGVA